MKGFLGVAFSLAVIGCSTSPEPVEPVATVSAARARWADGSPANYRFDFQRHCFCVVEAVQPVTVEVRGGEIVSVVSRDGGQPVPDALNIEWYSIEDLFRLIDEAETGGQEVEVEYAPEGYPTRIVIGSLAADAGVEYQVGNVAPL
jgi:hypothetical protein